MQRPRPWGVRCLSVTRHTVRICRWRLSPATKSSANPLWPCRERLALKTLRFLTDIDAIEVPREKADELATRLRHPDAAKAIANADDRGVRFTSDEKAAVLATLGDWTQNDGIDAVGRELADLRTELTRDLHLPPFR